MAEIEALNEEEGLGLHKYHQDLIFGKFKRYYERYENRQMTKLQNFYEEKLRKAEKSGDKYLPEELSEVCA